MSKEMREHIERVKNWKQFLNENESLKDNKDNLELEGKPISLIRTLHAVGKWNRETQDTDKITRHEDFDGFIGKIGKDGGRPSPGFLFMDANGKMIGFVMYNKEKHEFVEGNSIYHYTYQGKTEEDKQKLQSVLDNLVDFGIIN